MKAKSMIKCFILFYIIIGIGIISAQDRRLEPPSTEGRLKHLSEKLNLTDEQVEKIELILNMTQSKMKMQREKMENQQKQSMEEIQDVMKNEDKEIEKILNDEQKKKFAELKKERMDRRPPMGDRQGPPPMGGRPGGEF